MRPNDYKDAYAWRISIHAPRERCDYRKWFRNGFWIISIHAPRERCDYYEGAEARMSLISIHAPRERCDPFSNSIKSSLSTFQSTHRVSDATRFPAASASTHLLFQSTHRVSDATIVTFVPSTVVKVFQSTHRVSDATIAMDFRFPVPSISIHAPRERCDS